jgi:hypothetical protein
MKAGRAYLTISDYANALKAFKKVQEEYPRSNEGREVEKYISFTEGKLNEKK